MIHQRIELPTSCGETVVMDAYVPDVLRETNPDVQRPAIVICPGGGYRFCSVREAEPVALRFLSEGFVTCVVWYRVHCFPGGESIVHDKAGDYKVSAGCKFPMPQQDAAAAVAYVRRHAQKWHVHPDKIAVMGFSAGGHLAASLAGLWQRAELWQEMKLTPEDVRPNAAVLCYPVVVADGDAHRGSFEHLSGGDRNVENHQQYSILNWVSENYPPTFLWHTCTDGSVPVQNSIRLAQALCGQHIQTELHIFPSGGHGLSLANEITAASEAQIVPEIQCWPDLAARFLRETM